MDVKQQPRIRLLLLVGSLVIALTIAACGVTTSTAGTGSTPAAQSPAAQSGTMPASTTSAVASHSQPIPEAAVVVLAPGTAHDAVSDTISITVQNTTGRTIYALAQFTDCSIISLEHRVGESWQPVHLCNGESPHPSVTPIAPGGEAAIQLVAATASSDAGSDATAQWPTGIYRAELTYTTSASEPFGQGTIAYSATFVIGS